MLGDDIVIANKSVAQAYLFLMETLGVDINLSKSVQSTIGGCEFAKKILIAGQDFSPIGVKELFQFINSPRHFKDLILNNKVLDHVLGVNVDFAAASLFLEDLFSSNLIGQGPKWIRTAKSTI